MVEISPATGHVHGAVRAGGHMLVGTRDGVNRVDPATCRLERVGESRDDLMAFMGDPSSLLLASDRPGPGSDMVNPLGLMTSTDGGDSWRAVSLGGPVDFHAMAENGDQVIGWITRGPPPIQWPGSPIPDPHPNEYRAARVRRIGNSGIREFGKDKLFSASGSVRDEQAVAPTNRWTALSR